MLVKMNLSLPVFARHAREKQQTVISRKHWINIDRMVMILLFAGMIAGALIFS